jgi:two-component system, sensor histidine kinase ChiS
MARITVVNDYSPFLELVEQMLGDAGHDVTTLNGQRVSVDHIASTQPDLLLIDVIVSGDSAIGWDVLALARTHPELRSLPVIVSTGEILQGEERLAELASLGNLHVLSKPFTAEALHRLTRQLLDGR